MRRRCASTRLADWSSAAITAMSSWSTISPDGGEAATAGCTRCSAIAIATAAMPPRPASARMCSTRCWSIATSRNPIPARRRACRPGCSCGSATASYDTLCHLIYPASRPGARSSATEIILHDRARLRSRARRSGDSRAPARACSAITSCSTPRPAPAPGRRLCHHPRHDLPAVRLSRAAGPRRRVQPRPHVRLLIANRRASSGPVAAAAKNAILSCRIDYGPG